MLNYSAARDAFVNVYEKDLWGGGSGPSSPVHNAPYMRMLADFMRFNGVRTVVDLGCGDWQHARAMDWSGMRYQGFDVVQRVIDINTKTFGSDTVTFHVLRSLDELPVADMVICKDMLQHLPNADVAAHLDLLPRLYKFALVTNDVFAWHRAQPENNINGEIAYGAYRQLRFDLPPFNRRVASLLQWEVADGDWRWTKNTYLLMA